MVNAVAMIQEMSNITSVGEGNRDSAALVFKQIFAIKWKSTPKKVMLF